MRILVYTGKGGVGKTSIAAATAVRCAARGQRTVILSTDLAHSLADSLDVRLGPEPIKVADNLWAQETDIYNNLQTHWGVVQEWLNAILRWSGEVDSVVAASRRASRPYPSSRCRCSTTRCSDSRRSVAWRPPCTPTRTRRRSSIAVGRRCSSRSPMAASDSRCRCRSPRAVTSACGRPATSSSSTSVRTDATSSCRGP